MEITTIERKAFELWKQKFEEFVNRMDMFALPVGRKRKSGWIIRMYAVY